MTFPVFRSPGIAAIAVLKVHISAMPAVDAANHAFCTHFGRTIASRLERFDAFQAHRTRASMQMQPITLSASVCSASMPLKWRISERIESQLQKLPASIAHFEAFIPC